MSANAYKVKVGKKLQKELLVEPDDSGQKDIRWKIQLSALKVLRFSTKENVLKNLKRMYKNAEEA